MNSNVIPGFQKMSKQRIFNKAVAHISTTRQQSRVNGCCMYGGTGCNAAPLLLKEAHETADSIGDWDCLVDSGYVPANNAVFIKELQDAHDYVDNGADFMSSWAKGMRKLAERWNLSTSTLDKVTV